MKRIILLFALLMGISIHSAQAQDSRTVQGIVVDESGAPMGGANITLRGTRQGTAADDNGRFAIRVPVSGNVVLDVEYLGYDSEAVSVGTRSDLRVVMRPQALTTGEVVVTGMGNIKKSDYTGSVTQIKMEDIIQPGLSLEQMLQGHIAGMSVVNTTGKVGAASEIRVRGTSTILGNQEPLWVVDGVVQAREELLSLPDQSSTFTEGMRNMRETAGSVISWLNPADIELITILKDASATAIYGSAASNGVIVITTKKATTPGLSVSYSGDFSVGQRPRYSQYDFMNSQEQMRFQQQMWEDRDGYSMRILPVGFGEIILDLQNKKISEAEYAEKFHRLETNNTDWFKLLTRNSFSQRHNIGISGVGDKVHSRFSVGFDRQSSEARGNNLKAVTASSSNTYRHEDKLIVDLQLSGSYRETEDYAFGVDPYQYAQTTSRTIPLYNEDGTLHYYYKDQIGRTGIFEPKDKEYDGYYHYNILNEINNTGARNRSLGLTSSLNVQVKILENLTFRGTASYQLSSGKARSWATENSHYIALIRGYDDFDNVLPGSGYEQASRLPHGGVLVRSNAMLNNYSFRGNVAWDKTFSELHHVMVQLGAEASSSSTKSDSDMQYGYLHYRGMGFANLPYQIDQNTSQDLATDVDWLDNNLIRDEKAAASVVDVRDNKISQFITAIYNYNDRYVMNFNARLDASNRFGQDQNKRFNPGWSLGFKWRAGNEPFMDWADWFYNFDVSASYGWRGNAVQAVSPYLIAEGADNISEFFNDYSMSIKSLPYPGLGWERKQDWNFGLDFTLFEGRLALLAEYYGSKAHVMTSREVPVSNGVAQAYIAGTVMKNSGWELTASATPIHTEDFSWTLSFNASKQKSKMVNDEIDLTVEDYLGGRAIVDGYSYGSFWAYDFLGLNAANGQPIFNYLSTGYRLPVTTNDPLDYLVLAGSSEPKFFGGLNTGFRYKNWNLGASFAMSFGTMRFLPAVYSSNGVPSPDRNLPTYFYKRWRKPGDETHTDVPSLPNSNASLNNIYLPDGKNNGVGDQRNIYDLYNQSTTQLAKGDYIRCGNISLSYDVPHTFTEKIKARRITLSASLSNPFVIAFDKKWEGRDPESGTWPARKTTSFSVNVAF